VRGIFFTGICFLLLFSACGGESQPADVSTEKADSSRPQIDSSKILAKAKVLDSIFNSFHRTRNFNGTVLIAQNGSIIYEDAFGYANLEKKDTLSTASIFQLASVSKQFTAGAIMLLQEKGKLKYNDPVEKYIPGFPYKGISIWHLLTHRSGLSNYMYFCEDKCSNKDTILTCQDVVCIMEESKPEVYYKPDTKFNYNNTNYILLAAIVERVSGMKFAEFAQRNIFDPLEMKSTFIYDRSKPIDNDKACTGYYSVKRKAEENYLDGVVGDKQVYSTVEDLYKWDQALYTDKFLKQNTLQEAWTPASKERKNGHNYGYGWRLWTLSDSTKVIYHNGWWHGFNSSFIRIPSDTITVIVLRNIANRSFHFYDLPEVLKVLKPEKYSSLFPALPADSLNEE
jgi:CubicO group peptidase (beta-lactamase class C family)